MVADDCPWTAARSFAVRLHGRGPGVGGAARRGSGANPQPCINPVTYTTVSKAMAKRAKEIFSANE